MEHEALLSGDPAIPSLPPTFTQVALLGRGAFGEVLRAIDGAGRRVAVKILAPALATRADMAWQLADEFRRLGRLDHPGFPRVYERGMTDAGLPFYSMALVEGPAVGAGHDASRVLADLADALAYLHGLGMVHGDLKPENVLAGPARFMILDVGLMGAAGRPRLEVAGSLAYLAPEALRRAPVEPAADLYALGVMAFELIEGRLPFAGSAGEIVRGHLQAPVPPVAGPLGPLVARLLAKEPADRPTAAAVRAWLAGEPEPPVVLGLRGGAFVGREAMVTAWQAALAGRRLDVVELGGAPGLGKTRALEELRLAAQLAGRAWAGAACFSDAGLPGAPVRAVVAQALALAAQPPDAVVAAWLAGEPTLADLEPTARQAAIFAAAAEALAAAAVAVDGLALGFDDWHLADETSQAFLALVRRTQPNAPLAVAMALNAPEPGLLAPFGEAETQEWLASRLAGTPPVGLAEALGTAAGGSPLLLDLTLEHLVASGGLVPGPVGWTLQPGARPVEAGEALSRAWAQRLAGLSGKAKRLAAVAAIVPGALPLPVLASGARLHDYVTVAEELAAAGVLWIQGGRARLAPGVPAVWRLPTPGVSSRLATVLDRVSREPDDLLLAARLALQGNDGGLAARLAGEAGRRTLALAAPAAALAWLRSALHRLPATAEVGERLAIALPLAEAARFADQLPDALEAYDLALALAPPPEDAARALIGRAKCLQMQGKYPEALAGYIEAEALAPDEGLKARAAASMA
ncbi:MAG: protein kinase, partial [Cyanobacteria bacterium RYN_339]|nr:protein kinase [Cyanobacteria bacterium RYN_339]